MRITLLLILLISSIAWSQNQTRLDSLNTDRLQTNRDGMITLGSWATANLLVSGIAYTQTEGAPQRLHEMNVIWNTVNLGIATAGYLGSRKKHAKGLSMAQTVEEQAKVERTLLFNAGLDIGYMAGGWALRERSMRGGEQAERWEGWGNSLIIQGGFLFIFDLSLYMAHKQKGGKKIHKLLQYVQPLPGGMSLTIPID